MVFPEVYINVSLCTLLNPETYIKRKNLNFKFWACPRVWRYVHSVVLQPNYICLKYIISLSLTLLLWLSSSLPVFMYSCYSTSLVTFYLVHRLHFVSLDYMRPENLSKINESLMWRSNNRTENTNNSPSIHQHHHHHHHHKHHHDFFILIHYLNNFFYMFFFLNTEHTHTHTRYCQPNNPTWFFDICVQVVCKFFSRYLYFYNPLSQLHSFFKFFICFLYNTHMSFFLLPTWCFAPAEGIDTVGLSCCIRFPLETKTPKKYKKK